MTFQIIWDAQNQKWMNKDHDEDEKESFKPPPKMTDLPAMQPPAMQPPVSKPIQNIPAAEAYRAPPTPLLQETITPSNSESAAKVPNLQSNMFKMQRNKSRQCVTHP